MWETLPQPHRATSLWPVSLPQGSDFTSLGRVQSMTSRSHQGKQMPGCKGSWETFPSMEGTPVGKSIKSGVYFNSWGAPLVIMEKYVVFLPSFFFCLLPLHINTHTHTDHKA